MQRQPEMQVHQLMQLQRQRQAQHLTQVRLISHHLLDMQVRLLVFQVQQELTRFLE